MYCKLKGVLFKAFLWASCPPASHQIPPQPTPRLFLLTEETKQSSGTTEKIQEREKEIVISLLNREKVRKSSLARDFAGGNFEKQMGGFFFPAA